jgi:hypothetical protein
MSCPRQTAAAETRGPRRHGSGEGRVGPAAPKASLGCSGSVGPTHEDGEAVRRRAMVENRGGPMTSLIGGGYRATGGGGVRAYKKHETCLM